MHAAWNLRRFRRIEAECFISDGDPLTDPGNNTLLDRLSRHQSRAQRAYYRALRELRVLQTNRALRAVKLPEAAAAEVPTMAGIGDLTKQSQSDVETEAVKRALDLIDYEGSVLQASIRQNIGMPPAPRKSENLALRL
jgi:hypothetical protein